MELDLASSEPTFAYKILTSLVTPRPIAWVSTLNEDGSINLAPFSFFNVFGSQPPLLIFNCGNRIPEGVPKDTARNIEREGEFVVNLVDEGVKEAMNQSAAALPYGSSELDLHDCTVTASPGLRPPRVTASPASLECNLHKIEMIGNNRLIYGLIQHVHVRDGLVDPETFYLDPPAYKPIGRMQGPDGYVYCRDRFEFQWPR
jgi:flavin reductase (DIM6/NTAB) family NADH-FMN oxidoreductase RutF